MKTKDFTETIHEMPHQELEALCLIMLGYISTHPKFSNMTPDEVLKYFTNIVEYTRLSQDDEVSVVFYYNG